MNGLFYLDEIFYSENSPYLYDIDTFSELQPSRVPFMANGRGSGKRANRSDVWADPAETELYLFRAIRFALRGVRYSVRKNNLCTEKYEPV